MTTVPESFICAISSEIMADPVSTADGFSYEREAITEWFANNNKTSPLTGAPLEHTHLVPNHALRAAIQEFVNAHPEAAKDLYRPQQQGKRPVPKPPVAAAPPPPSITVASSGSLHSISDVSDAHPLSPVSSSSAANTAAAGHNVPMGIPVSAEVPVMPVQPPPPPPIGALSAEDLASCAPFAVPDWRAYAMPPKLPPSTGWFSSFTKTKAPKGAANGGAFAQASPRGSAREETGGSAEVLEPSVRVGVAEGGGVALTAEIASSAALHRLAMRLAAPGSQPLAALTLTAKDGFGPGTGAPFDCGGAGFALLCRALFTATRGGSSGGADALLTLRALNIDKIGVDADAADALAQGLRGHPALEALDLYNVGLDDAGALPVARLAFPDGNAALRRLNLGRNLLLGETIIELEGSIDSGRVRANFY